MSLDNQKGFNEIVSSQRIHDIFSDITVENLENITDQCQFLVQTDMEGTILYATDSYKNFFGRGENTILGKKIYQFDHPAFPKSIQRILGEQVSQDDDTNAIFIHKTLKGTVACLYAEIDVIKDRHGEHIHIFTRKKRIPTKNIFEKIIPFYKLLLQKEEEEGVESAYNYIKSFIERNEFGSFNNFIDYLAYGEN